MSKLLDELKIDYLMLRKQRDQLCELIWNNNNSDLWGLVALLDALIEGESE